MLRNAHPRRWERKPGFFQPNEFRNALVRLGHLTMSLSSHFLLSKYAKTNWKRIKNIQQCSGPTFILLLLLAIFELFVLYALKPYILRDTSPYFLLPGLSQFLQSNRLFCSGLTCSFILLLVHSSSYHCSFPRLSRLSVCYIHICYAFCSSSWSTGKPTNGTRDESNTPHHQIAGTWPCKRLLRAILKTLGSRYPPKPPIHIYTSLYCLYIPILSLRSQ